jgi:diguanylate cyclase (GGDEF)-like protein
MSRHGQFLLESSSLLTDSQGMPLLQRLGRLLRACTTLLWCVLCMGMLLGWGAARAMPEPVRLGDNAQLGEASLQGHIEKLEDPSGQWGLAEVRSPNAQWLEQASPTANFGFSKSAWWLRVRLFNAGQTAEVQQVLDLGNALQDYVDFYVVRAQGTAISHVATGDRRPFASRGLPTANLALPITVQAQETVEVYVRLATWDGLHDPLALSLRDVGHHVSHTQDWTLSLGLYTGILVSMLVFNAFLFYSTREAPFGYYVAYVLAFSLMSLTYRGFGYQYFWPEHPNVNNQMLAISVGACYVTFGLFTLSYLRGDGLPADRLTDALRRGLRWSTALNAVCLLIPPLTGSYAVYFVVDTLAAATMLVLGPGLGLRLYWRGYQPAKFFMLAFLVLVLGIVTYYLRMLQVLPPSVAAGEGWQVGSALEMMLLAFGLAHQMNSLKAEKLHAEQVARQAQDALTTQLEAQVRQRTQELEAATTKLKDMAFKDELTGLFNRRHMAELFEHHMKLTCRMHQNLSVAIIDLDHFKRVNDTLGHGVGDEVLRGFARQAEGILRETDVLARWGGEEFLLMMPNTSAEQGLLPLLRLRQALAKTAVAAGAPELRVSFSAGLTTYQAGETMAEGSRP